MGAVAEFVGAVAKFVGVVAEFMEAVAEFAGVVAGFVAVFCFILKCLPWRYFILKIMNGTRHARMVKVVVTISEDFHPELPMAWC